MEIETIMDKVKNKIIELKNTPKDKIIYKEMFNKSLSDLEYLHTSLFQSKILFNDLVYKGILKN